MLSDDIAVHAVSDVGRMSQTLLWAHFSDQGSVPRDAFKSGVPFQALALAGTKVFGDTVASMGE